MSTSETQPRPEQAQLRASPRPAFLRRSECLLIGYFIYAAVLGQILDVRPQISRLVLLTNLLVIGGFLLLAYVEPLRRRKFFSILRDWYPYPLMLLAYREMGWFAPREHTYELERAWIVWDRRLLNEWGLREAIELFSPVLPALLELAYALVYTIPVFVIVVLYLHGHRERLDGFLMLFLLGILIPYALFPYFPSEPPRAVFPGQDFPSAMTPFRKLNWWLLGGWGIHTSVFPSAHVSGSFSAAFAMIVFLPEHRCVGRVLLVMAVLIATAVVYGRYHYAVDTLAGFGVSLLALGITIAVERRSRRSFVR